MFSVRWLSLAGGMIGERISDGNVLAGISLFFGGRHSLLRSWLDFMLILILTHVPQQYLRYLSLTFGLLLLFLSFVFPLSLTFYSTFLSPFFTLMFCPLSYLY